MKSPSTFPKTIGEQRTILSQENLLEGVLPIRNEDPRRVCRIAEAFCTQSVFLLLGRFFPDCRPKDALRLTAIRQTLKPHNNDRWNTFKFLSDCVVDDSGWGEEEIKIRFNVEISNYASPFCYIRIIGGGAWIPEFFRSLLFANLEDALAVRDALDQKNLARARVLAMKAKQIRQTINSHSHDSA